MKCHLEAQSAVLEAALHDAKTMLVEVAKKISPADAARMANLRLMERMCNVMAELPAILLIESRGAKEWMEEEITSRFDPTFVAIVEEVGNIFKQSKARNKMISIGIIWFVAQDIILKHGFESKTKSSSGSKVDSDRAE